MERQGLQSWEAARTCTITTPCQLLFLLLTFIGHPLFSKCDILGFIFQTILWSRELSPFYRPGNHSAHNGNFPMTTQSVRGFITQPPKKSDSTFCALNHCLPLYYPHRVWPWASLLSPAAKWGSYTGTGSLGGVYKTWARKDKLPKEMIWDSTLPITHLGLLFMCTYIVHINKSIVLLYKTPAKWELFMLMEVETEPG